MSNLLSSNLVESKLTNFGKVIRKIRIDHDINLKQLASLIGVSSAFLSSVETGKIPLNIELITKIISVLPLTKSEKDSLKNTLDY